MGYFDKMEDESLATRKLAAIIMGVNGSKNKIEAVWPLRDQDMKVQIEAPTKEWWEQVKKIHGLKSK